MIKKLLIANRGEIACRIIHTAHKMGVTCVAVYSTADQNSLHVKLADEAHLIGPAAPSESYLNRNALIKAAQQSGADAVHPGYGFLAENEEFAEAVLDAGLIFIGPSSESIRLMGSKNTARTIMQKAGVPVVPGYHGHKQNLSTLKIEAERIGYPLMLKAAAGGGGKGMRIVASPEQLEEALSAVKREAKSSFGDSTVLMERYLEKTRHVEIQVFGDRQGNIVHLFERDCSLQRRHQKVIEEAPAPGIKQALREQMGSTAVNAAKAIDYQGAGTCEFLLDDSGNHYFLEMNTRIQVEHPVTEMITGIDLIEWQLRIAVGEALPLMQDQISFKGHAIEARLYAENPSNDFLPSTGTLDHLRFPERAIHLRIETGVEEGDDVTPFYDPMIAKLVVWADSRKQAIHRLKEALEKTQVVGLESNRDFLRALLAGKEFQAGKADTGLIDRRGRKLIPQPLNADLIVLSIASLFVTSHLQQAASKIAAHSADPTSPWQDRHGWRIITDAVQRVRFEGGITVSLTRVGEHIIITEDGSEVCLVNRFEVSAGDISIYVDGHCYQASVYVSRNSVTLFFQGDEFRLKVLDADDLGNELESHSGNLLAPMPGKIISVSVAAGADVKTGDPLMVLEAMKMEHTIAAPEDGQVLEVYFNVGDQVEDGAELLRFDS